MRLDRLHHEDDPAVARAGGRRHVGPGRVHAAFSLIELLVVLMILAVLAAIAAPRYAHALAGQRADATARRIAADLQYAQRQAKFTGSSRRVTFNVANHFYNLSNTPGLESPAGLYRVYLARDPYRASIVSADFGGDPQVIFDGYGVPDTNGTVTIAVGSFQRSVSVDGGTGGIQAVKLLPKTIQ